jgi:hypothetical protein
MKSRTDLPVISLMATGTVSGASFSARRRSPHCWPPSLPRPHQPQYAGTQVTYVVVPPP